MGENRRAKIFAALFALVLIALVAAGCGSSSSSSSGTTSEEGGSTEASNEGGSEGESEGGTESGKTVYAAVPVDLTGAGAGLGIPWKQAVNAAVAYVNASGGMNGAKLVPEFKDTQSDQSTAAQVTNEMLSSGKYEILFIGAGGNETLPILEATKRYPNVAVLGSGTVPAFGEGSAYPMGFETDNSPEEAGEQAACLMKQRGSKKVGIIGLNDEYTTTSDASATEKLEEEGLEVVGHEEIGLTDTNVTPQLQKLQQAGADTVFADAYFTPLNSVLTGLKALGWEPKLIISRQGSSIPLEFFAEESDYPKEAEALGFSAQVKSKEGFTPAQKTAIKYIEQQVHGKYAGTLSLYAFVWDAVMLARWGADEAHSTEGKAIVEALETLHEHPEAETGALIQEAPPYTDEVHKAKDVTLYGLNSLAPMEHGTQPGTGQVIEPGC